MYQPSELVLSSGRLFFVHDVVSHMGNSVKCALQAMRSVRSVLS